MENKKKAIELCNAAAAGDLQKVTNLINDGIDVNSYILGGTTALMKGSINGHLEVIKFLIEKGANVNQTDKFGYNALLWAVDKRIAGFDTITYLVEHKCNVNAKAKETGYTPLHWVAQNGNLDQAKYLIEHGASINETTTKKETPVHLAAAAGHGNLLDYFLNQLGVNFGIFDAARKGYTKAVQYFIERRKIAADSVDWRGISVLIAAVDGGSLEIIKYLVEVKAVSVNQVSGSERTSSLHEAAAKGHIQVVLYLLKKGADIHIQDSSGRTPLFWATYYGKLDILKYFVEVEKDDVNRIDTEGNTLLHIASWGGFLNVNKYLVEEIGLDVNARTKNKIGDTPLLYAIRYGRLDIFYYFLQETKADFNLGNNQNVTCLHWAALKAYIGSVKALVDRGMNINVKDEDGKTPLFWAVGGNHVAALAYFIEEKKANAFQRDNKNSTLLHEAALSGAYLSTVEYLVEKQGLDINAINNRGETPLTLSIERENEEITEYLKSKNTSAHRRRRRSAPSSDIPTAINSAYRHYSVINHVSNYALSITSGCLASSSKPFIKAGSAMKSISNFFDLLGGFLMLLNVGCRKLFHRGSQPYGYSESKSLLSPPQLMALRIDPNATIAVGESFRYETEF